MTAQFFFLLQIVAPVFAVMALGYLMRKIGILSGEADRSLTRLVVTLLAPALALDTIIGNAGLANPKNWILPPVLGFASIALGIAVSRLGARCFRIPADERRRTFVFATSVQNYGYIPLPLCNALFGRETMGVLFAFFLGVELAFWSIALAQLTGHTEKRNWRRILNAPIIAISSAIILNALGAKTWLPSSIATTFHLLGACAVPLGLLLSGALIADYVNWDSVAPWETDDRSVGGGPHRRPAGANARFHAVRAAGCHGEIRAHRGSSHACGHLSHRSDEGPSRRYAHRSSRRARNLRHRAVDHPPLDRIRIALDPARVLRVRCRRSSGAAYCFLLL
ncbi:MAG TPA: AEC family transporter [Terrimicrobiaceae bacterium]|nr:AEC family transporter [Terrimicrobiaceae bacterium]